MDSAARTSSPGGFRGRAPQPPVGFIANLTAAVAFPPLTTCQVNLLTLNLIRDMTLNYFSLSRKVFNH